MRSTLLLLATDPDEVIEVAGAAREAGFQVTPGRAHELAIDSLTRVHADVVLLHVQHEGAESVAFSALAQYRGVRVFLFANRDGPPEERAQVSLVSSRSPFPVLMYSGLASELIQSVQSALGDSSTTRRA
jgi:hypothetical protein